MKTHRLSTFIFALSTIFVACTQQPPMSIHWEMGQNDVQPGICELYYTITNLSDEPITNEGWTLYFNYMSLHPIYTEGDQILQTELQASYHSITPTAEFQPLMPDSSRTFKLRFKGNAIRQTSRPEGFFLVKGKCKNGKVKGGKPISIPCTYAPFTRPEQMKRGIVTWEKTPYADGPYVYDYVQNILSGEEKFVQPLLPQPKKMEYTDGVCEVAKAEIVVRTDANMVSEGYTMIITPTTITIEASDEAGHEGNIELKKRTIEDLDRRVVQPIFEAVNSWSEPVAIAILPDHPTPCSLRTHTAEPVPFLIWHPNIQPDAVQSFDETAALEGSYGLLQRDEFIRAFMEKD
jgi:hypothetical protein